MNPPWALLDEVAHKLREEGAAATVVAPYWPGQSWFKELKAPDDGGGHHAEMQRPVHSEQAWRV